MRLLSGGPPVTPRLCASPSDAIWRPPILLLFGEDDDGVPKNEAAENAAQARAQAAKVWRLWANAIMFRQTQPSEKRSYRLKPARGEAPDGGERSGTTIMADAYTQDLD